MYQQLEPSTITMNTLIGIFILGDREVGVTIIQIYQVELTNWVLGINYIIEKLGILQPS